MPVYQLKLSTPATFTDATGWSFVKNPTVVGAPISADPTFNTVCSGGIWFCLSNVVISGNQAAFTGVGILDQDNLYAGSMLGTVFSVEIEATGTGTMDVTLGGGTAVTYTVGSGRQILSITAGNSPGGLMRCISTNDSSLTYLEIGTQASQDEITTAVTHTPQTISPTDLPAFDMNWVVDPTINDVVEARYVPGNYTDGDPNDNFINSIYSGAKDVTIAEQVEAIATGVTGFEVINPAGGIVTLTVDGVFLGTIAAGATTFFEGAGTVLGYSRDVAGTITLSQGKFIAGGPPMEAQNFTLFNCDGTFTASIYQGTKTTDATIRTEPLATGATKVLVQSNAGTGLVTVYNNGNIIGTVFDGEIKQFDVTSGTVGWSSPNAGTIELGQGVA